MYVHTYIQYICTERCRVAKQTKHTHSTNSNAWNGMKMRCHLLAFLHVGCLQGIVVPSNINSMRTCRYLWRERGGEGRGEV